MKKIFIILTLIMLISCAQRSDQNNPSVDPSTKSTKTDMCDWELVGEKEHCKLYQTICHGHRVFWSICTDYNGNMTSSVSSD